MRLFLEVSMGNVFISLCSEASGHAVSKLGLVLGVINVVVLPAQTARFP